MPSSASTMHPQPAYTTLPSSGIDETGIPCPGAEPSWYRRRFEPILCVGPYFGVLALAALLARGPLVQQVILQPARAVWRGLRDLCLVQDSPRIV